MLPASHRSHTDLQGDIQVVYDRYEEGRKTLSELIRFFTDRIDADTSYAKDISKLVTKAYSVTERGCAWCDYLFLIICQLCR